MANFKKLMKVLPVFILLISISCNPLYPLKVLNNYEETIFIRFGLYKAPETVGIADTVTYSVFSHEEKVIRTRTFRFVSDIRDLELRILLVLNEDQDTLELDRVTANFLEMANWKFSFPLRNFSIRENFIEDWVKIHGIPHYNLVQMYYNHNDFDSCLFSISGNLIDSLENILFSDNAEWHDRELAGVKLRGYCVLGFLSAARLAKYTHAARFWVILLDHFPEYANFIKINDPEIKNFYNYISVE